MSPNSWPRVKGIVQEALERAPDARAALVAEACSDDSDLRGEVESLLAAYERAGTFIDAPLSPAAAARIVSELAAAAHKLQQGIRLGPYEIVDALGAGGMGEVYRARDTRLDRTVAIKVLPARVAHEPRARERFEREARAVASLNHPHICTLHDVGNQEGLDFLVMEFLEGETLPARLAQGPLPMAHALQFAIQIVSALDTAHRAGIVHRDLKPGNVFLVRSGGASALPIAKLLDFGLAKAMTPAIATSPAAMAASPDLTAPGLIVGTVQYMAPEQIDGKEADGRTDIFAFGTVLFEMLTGRKAFEADSNARLMAAILEREPPPLSSLQPLATPALERIVHTCLAKDPDDRWQTARDLLRELQWLAESDAEPGDARVELDDALDVRRASASAEAPKAEASGARPAARRRISMAIVLGVIALIAVASAVVFRARPVLAANADAAAREYPKALTDNLAEDVQPDWSRDGRRILFASAREGNPDIYVMDADGSHVTNLTNNPATDQSPVWSPDMKVVAFESDRAPGTGIYVMSATGHDPRRLGSVRDQGGRPAWSPDSTRIAFMSGSEQECEIYVINADGTGLTRLTHNDHFDGDPAWSPDGRKIAFTHSVDDDLEIYVMDADGANQTRLTFSLGYDGVPSWSPDATRIAFHSTRDGGTDIYVMAGDGSDPIRITHNGKNNGDVSWSPDGTKLVFQSARRGNSDIYIAEAIPDTATRCTSSVAQDRWPSWSPDGSHLAFSSNRNGPSRILKGACGEPATDIETGQGAAQHPAWSAHRDRIAFASDRDGQYDLYLLAGGAVKNLTRGSYKWAGGMAWSPDGSQLALTTIADGGAEIVILDAAGRFLRRIASSARLMRELAWSPDGSQFAFAAGPHQEGPYNFEIYAVDADGSHERRLTTHSAYDSAPTWSPDGRRIAFLSERSGASDVYLMDADGGRMTRVTHTPWPEATPAWAPDGRHLALASNPNGNLDIYVYDLAGVLRNRF